MSFLKKRICFITANAYVCIYFVMREERISKESSPPKQVYLLSDKAGNWNINSTKKKEDYALPRKLVPSIIRPLTFCTAWETLDSTLPQAFRSAPGEFLSNKVGSCEYIRNTDEFCIVSTLQQLSQ